MNAIPTDDHLQKRGLPWVSCCSLCNTLCCVETPFHLFLHCNFAQAIWDRIASLFQVPSLSYNVSIVDFWVLVVAKLMSSQLHNLWVVAIELGFFCNLVCKE